MPENTIKTNALYSKIEDLLKSIPDFVTEENELRYNKIKEAAENGNPILIEPLLNDSKIKASFFTPVLDSFVFKTKDFKEFLDYSSSNNSYSQYLGKKIGLYCGDTALIDRNEVVLNFPFKDCVLEGGQRKEDGIDKYFTYDEKKKDYVETKDKRREIFFNETLARDEIDSLFEAKAFCNVKRYESKKKPAGITHFNRDAEINKKRGLSEDTITDNLVIKGNNLLALYSLKKEFEGKIKLIYIDPPYNTGSDDFKYNDNFNHSSWLTFMKNRLEVARDLLKDDGAIYVQVDYHEAHYLKVLMDEVFGEKNFQREIIWRIGWLSGYKTIDNNWIRNHDTILFYSKNSSNLDFHKYYIPKQEFKKNAVSDAEQYPIEDIWNGNEYDDLNSIAIVSFAGETVSKLLNKDDEVKGQKSEKLLERIIKAHTEEHEIVLDMFSGTGTTGAVSHKMNRQYILCEQLAEHIDITNRRLSKVIEGEQSGISKRNNWKGGGSFIYMELAEKNEKAMRLISACKDLKELEKVFKILCEKYFLHYNVRVHDFINKTCKEEEFKKLTLKRQKEIFMRMIDLNQLYVNVSDRNDKDSGLTKNDISATEDFYRIKDGE
ncbi:MAG: site-specific DNA-methyltransferase [Treponema sp.]|uniref:site-specific DNA-methyltransferase n=1 Tax=Treponema sp. TaxID=166 RepID=UPI00298ECB8E|nr:DNA methyltransferase [Treponema sp.]MCR5386422.1 site-specific DNA-methyltransferase [Treponema sp.]